MRKYWIVAIGLLVLASCSPPSPAVPGSAPAGVPNLAGTSWVVTGITGASTLPDHQPTLEFEGDQVSGSASCNRFNAGYTQSAGAVKIAPGALTAMACSPDTVMAQEQAFTTALAKVAAARTTATGLDLLDETGEVVMTLKPAPPVPAKPLAGTTWQLSGLIAGDAVSSPVTDTTVTFTITGDQLNGKACNTFRGTVTVSGDSFKTGPLVSTKMACADPAENAQETQVLDTLQAVSSYAITGEALTLKAADGSGLEFRAA